MEEKIAQEVNTSEIDVEQGEMQQPVQTKKRMNIILFTLIMLGIFLFVTEVIIYGYGGQIIYQAVSAYPQGKLVITETILAVMVLIVLLLFKNSYIFTEKKDSIKTGLFYGLFYLIGSGFFFLIFGLLGGGLFSGLALFNVFVGALLVGLCEEFLCRGWLLNEFLERYGDTKKGVWYSIIISGLIFGLIHLGNFFHGQDLVSTVTQIMNASAIGVVFGIIYYKTKNIWSVIILHGLWDFSLFLGNVSPIIEVTETFNSFSVLGIIFNILMISSQLIIVIPYLKDIDAKPYTSRVIGCSIIGFVLYMVFLILTGIGMDSGKTYKYGSIEIDNFAITRDNYSEYNFNYKKEDVKSVTDEFGNVTPVVNKEEYSFKLTYNEDMNIILSNEITDSQIELECEDLIDFIVLEEDEYFIVAYEDYRDKANTYLNYAYLYKKELSNDKDYLRKLKDKFKKYLLPDRLELMIIEDKEKDKKYLTAYDVDYGYYLLASKNKISRLER